MDEWLAITLAAAAGSDEPFTSPGNILDCGGPVSCALIAVDPNGSPEYYMATLGTMAIESVTPFVGTLTDAHFEQVAVLVDGTVVNTEPRSRVTGAPAVRPASVLARPRKRCLHRTALASLITWRRRAARRVAAHLCASLCVVFSSACAPRHQHVVERKLTSKDALECPGYLVWNREPVRDVFLVINGSGILSNAFVHPAFDGILRRYRVGYLTYDKPGIRAPFGDPAAVHRDDALFERYTLGHGIECAIQALSWARERFGAAVRLHVRGHSEGTLVGLYAYEALLDRDRAAAAAIETFVFSGLALEPFEVILERQLASVPNGARLREALASCDWPVLKTSLGVSCAYVADATRRPSGRAMFERLARRAPAARFHVFHGTGDWNTPVEPVRALEAWNTAEGHFFMHFHYYEGAHASSEAARSEMSRLLSALASD